MEMEKVEPNGKEQVGNDTILDLLIDLTSPPDLFPTDKLL